MIRFKSTCPSCGCGQRVRAKNASMVVHKGSLQGTTALERGDPRSRLTPLVYEVIDFCANPVCERVFRAVRKDAVEESAEVVRQTKAA